MASEFNTKFGQKDIFSHYINIRTHWTKIFSLSNFWHECRSGRPWCLIHYTHLADYWWWTTPGWVVALWWCRWVGADGNNVRPMKGRERPYGGNLPLIWTDGQHCPIKWIMPPEQFYGVRCFIFCESLAVFQRTGSGPGRALARHNNSLEPKTVSARNLATVFFPFSVNYSCWATIYFFALNKNPIKNEKPC